MTIRVSCTSERLPSRTQNTEYSRIGISEIFGGNAAGRTGAQGAHCKYLYHCAQLTALFAIQAEHAAGVTVEHSRA